MDAPARGPQVRHDDQGHDALDLAFRALDAALVRHRAAARDPIDFPVGYASAAEAAWWVASIAETPKGSEEPASRGGTPDDAAAKMVLGLQWVRDRHSHQLPITTPTDDTSFFGPPGSSYVYYISPGMVWRPYDDFTDKGRSRESKAEAYRDYVGGQKSIRPLLIARNELARRVGLPEAE